MSDVSNINIKGTSYPIKAPYVKDTGKEEPNNQLSFWTGLSSVYTNLTKDDSTIYVCSDTAKIYLGSTELSKVTIPAPTLQPIQTTTGSITLTDNVSFYKLTPSGATTITFTNSTTASSSSAYTFELCVIMSTVYSLTFPSSVTWQDGTTPTMTNTGIYFFAFRTIDGGSTWKGSLQGVWQ